MRFNLVIRRYTDPETVYGVLPADTSIQPRLIRPEDINVLLELGNEVDFDPDELRIGDQIPLEWKKSPICTDEWLKDHITAYDRIIIKT